MRNLRIHEYSIMNTTPLPESILTPVDQRTLNRDRVGDFVYYVISYSVSFALVYLFFCGPIMEKVSLLHRDFYLNEARVIGSVLPHVKIEREFIQLPLILLALAVYFPVCSLSKMLAAGMGRFFDKFFKVTHVHIFAYRLLVFFLLCPCLTIISIWMFNHGTLLEAVFTFGEGAASCLTMAFGMLFVTGSVINRVRRVWEGYF